MDLHQVFSSPHHELGRGLTGRRLMFSCCLVLRASSYKSAEQLCTIECDLVKSFRRPIRSVSRPFCYVRKDHAQDLNHPVPFKRTVRHLLSHPKSLPRRLVLRDFYAFEDHKLIKTVQHDPGRYQCRSPRSAPLSAHAPEAYVARNVFLSASACFFTLRP